MLTYKNQKLHFHHLLVGSHKDFCRDVEEYTVLSTQGAGLQFSHLYCRYAKALAFSSMKAELSTLSAGYGLSLQLPNDRSSLFFMCHLIEEFIAHGSESTEEPWHLGCAHSHGRGWSRCQGV